MTVGVLIGAGDVAAATLSRLHDSVDRVVALDLSADRLDALSSVAGAAEVARVAGDINDEEARAEVVRRVVESGLQMSWVVLTSGIGVRGSVEEFEPVTVRTAFETNVISPILLIQALVRDCGWAAQGRIVGLGSISARRPLAHRTVYGATKAALETFLMSLGAELAPRGIVVNVVSAGVVDSAFIAAAREDLTDWATARVPTGRLGHVDEIGDVIAYLVRAAPSYLSATRVVVDGGAEAFA